MDVVNPEPVRFSDVTLIGLIVFFVFSHSRPWQGRVVMVNHALQSSSSVNLITKHIRQGYRWIMGLDGLTLGITLDRALLM